MVITEQENQASLVMNAFHREMEVHSYQVNINNYTLMLEKLPKGEWPTDIAMYWNVPISDLPMNINIEDVARINDYQYRDQITKLLRTELMEQNKSKQILEVIKDQITGDYDTLVQAFKATQ